MEDKDMEKKMKEFGLETLDLALKYLPNSSKNMKTKMTYAHRSFGKIASTIANNEDFAVISGINSSGPLHLGHKNVFEEVKWLQEQGGEVYIPVTDDETYVTGKAESIKSARKTAYEEVIPSLIAFGFDPKKTNIFVHTDYPQIYKVGMYFSKKVTTRHADDIFGLMDKNVGTFFHRGASQMGSILMPQLEEFGGPKPTVVPVGIDQDTYILLTRDIARKFDLEPPSGLYLSFQRSLSGEGKMSSSKPESCIFLTDEIKDVKRKINNAFTGGRGNLEDQKKYGGEPEKCVIFDLYENHFSKSFKETERISKNCLDGERLCGKCKKELFSRAESFLKNHQKKREEAKDKIDEYLLDRNIKSISGEKYY